MSKIYIPEHYNYIGVFLTYACNMHCSYCINLHSTYPKYPKSKELSGKQWVKAINRIKTRDNLPITLCGGEPTMHRDFYYIINHIDPKINIDILTNGMFDLDEFIARVEPERLRRDSKYASIRFSHHPGYTDVNDLLYTVKEMQDIGYSVGIWGVDHPDSKKVIDNAYVLAKLRGIDYRKKEFLGWHHDKLYGTYKYDFAMDNNPKTVMCEPSELLVAPDGTVHNCHYNLYNRLMPMGKITTSPVLGCGVICHNCGLCNPCDQKLKFDRHQVGNHCSVEIELLT